jgi:hypothetical protein
MIVIDTNTYSVLVLTGRIEETNTHIRCSKSYPLKVVEFVQI